MSYYYPPYYSRYYWDPLYRSPYYYDYPAYPYYRYPYWRSRVLPERTTTSVEVSPGKTTTTTVERSPVSPALDKTVTTTTYDYPAYRSTYVSPVTGRVYPSIYDRPYYYDRYWYDRYYDYPYYSYRTYYL